VSGDRTKPSESTLKVLLALTGNRCAFADINTGKGCEEVLAHPSWPRVKGKVCHISGAHPGSARYDDSMTDKERRHFANLIVLCPNHHELIDYLEPEQYTVSALLAMKERHEARTHDGTIHQWASDAELARYADLVFVVQYGDMPKVVGQVDVTLGDFTAGGTGAAGPPPQQSEPGSLLDGDGSYVVDENGTRLLDGNTNPARIDATVTPATVAAKAHIPEVVVHVSDSDEGHATDGGEVVEQAEVSPENTGTVAGAGGTHASVAAQAGIARGTAQAHHAPVRPPADDEEAVEQRAE
jgi:hypothetical protein